MYMCGVYGDMNMCVCVHTYICVYMYVCLIANLCMCVCVCLCVCVCEREYVFDFGIFLYIGAWTTVCLWENRGLCSYKFWEGV